jgi:putative ABC transport system permease protein
VRTFRALYRLALRAWPSPFRLRHQDEALRMAEARVREESGARRVRMAARELGAALVAAPRLRRATLVQTGRSLGGGTMIDGVVSDARYALRSLARTPGFLATGVTTLSVSIALCAAVMVVANIYLVRGLPYPESGRLYTIRYGGPGMPFVQGLEKLDWRSLHDLMEHPISWDLDLFSLRGAPYPEAIEGTWATPGYMDAFGVRPVIGRAFTPDDYRETAAPIAIISHRLWQRRFDGDPAILGRHVDAYMNDRPDEPQRLAIVGVLAADHWHLNRFTDILSPLRAPSYPYMARLRPGVAPDIVAARIESLARGGGLDIPAGWTVTLASSHEEYVRTIRPVLVAVAVATVLVVLIACSNVAVLFTLRASQRRREVAVRRALGASATRLVRTLAADAIAIGLLSTAIGIGLAQAILELAAPALERSLGRPAPGGVATVQLDGVTVIGAILAGAFVTALCGLAQAWASRRAPASLALTGGQKGGGAGPGQRRAHTVMIAAEIAASLALLAGATLMIQSGLRILRVDMGQSIDDVRVGRVSLSQQKYADAPSRLALYERVAAETAALPGVQGAGFATGWPLQQAPQRPVGRDGDRAGFVTRAGLIGIGPGYFEALHIGVVAGRAFEPRDRLGAEPRAIVSRELAHRLWPDESAVGRLLRLGPAQQGGASPPAPYVVVGVAADIRHTHTDDDLADVYVPLLQFPTASASIYVRTGSGPGRVDADLRALLRRIDPDLSLAMPRDLADVLDEQRAAGRFLAALLAVFAAFATALALVGIYGAIASTVRQREREIAVRLAVGADARAIVMMFVRQGLVMLAAGLAIGAGGAVAIGRVLQSQLFGVEPADPAALAGATAAFMLCGVLAIAWPARRAASTDPALALKES